MIVIVSIVLPSWTEHSACTMGNYTTTKGATRRGFEVTETIQFEQEFEQIPNVIASIAAFDAGRLSAFASVEYHWGIETNVMSVTTSSFVLHINGMVTSISPLTIAWIACEWNIDRQRRNDHIWPISWFLCLETGYQVNFFWNWNAESKSNEKHTNQASNHFSYSQFEDLTSLRKAQI